MTGYLLNIYLIGVINMVNIMWDSMDHCGTPCFIGNWTEYIE